MRSLAIIPARAGSKRVERKNLQEVGGITLLVRAMDAAAACDVTVVSTDDIAVKNAAGIYRVLRHPDRDVCVHDRQPKHATDDAGLEDVIADVIAAYDRVGSETHGIGVDAFVLLQPTSPFRTAAHVSAALAMLKDTGCDSVVSGEECGFFVALAERPNADGSLPGLTGERRRSQDCAGEWFRENGAVYAFTREHWERTKDRRGGRCLPLYMSRDESIEIDTMDDLRAARALAEGMAPEGVP